MERPRYQLKTAPAFDPVSTDEIKHNLRITTTDFDTLIGELIDYVIESVQANIGRQIARATYYAYLDGYPDGDEMEITLGPVATITSIKYYAPGSSELTEFSSSKYQLDNTELTARIRFLESFQTDTEKMNAVVIEFTNGYADANSVPKNIKDALVLLVSERYLNPDNRMLNFGVSIRQSAAERLLRNYRVQRY